MKSSSFLRQTWYLIKPFWSSKERGMAALLSIVTLSCAIFEVYMSVRLTKWNGDFYNSLQLYDQQKFFMALISGSIIMLLFVLATTFTYYSSSVLEIKWRKWLTEHYLQLWMDSGTYYFSEFIAHKQDNPDQRISDDVHQFVNLTIKIIVTGFRSFISLGSFLVLLWGFSGNFTFHIANYAFYIPGYMVWLALLYAFIGTYVTFKIGNPLINLNYQQQRYEADFRYSLVRIRENSQQIAAYKGEGVESKHASKDFESIVSNFMQVLKCNFKINLFNYTYGQVSTVIPTIISAGRYFAKKITLGDMMQINSAFARVQFSIAFLIYMYADIATWRAVMNRLSDFIYTIEQSKDIINNKINSINQEVLEVQNLSVYHPDGRVMIDNLSFKAARGERILFSGKTGLGKSSLFKCLNGLWPHLDGVINKHYQGRSLFIAQQPYLPLLNLKEAVCYPLVHNLPSDAEIAQFLTDCGLEYLVSELYSFADWGKILSIGEQQKIAFCRVLINQPDIVYLDESSSALDAASELELYNLLHTKLPQMIILTISHKIELRQIHDRVIFLS